jgi:chorismate synthase
MNSLGEIFKVTSFGESHGPAVGCVIEGCPAGLKIDLNAIQQQLQRRSTSQNNFSSARKEPDELEILSGIFNERTLGSPITFIIKNKDAQSSDYNHLEHVFRPGHADYTNELKYGIRDHRGGGRTSMRITAPLVVAGELANQLIQHFATIYTIAYVSRIGNIEMPANYNFSNHDIDESPVRCPHPASSSAMLQLVESIQTKGNTLGGIITCIVQGLPAGIGEPIFGKLSARLALAMCSINTVKGVEFGEGFHHASMLGSESNDSFFVEENVVKTKTNHSGGIQGGISNGMPITFNVAFKPISSIQQPQQTIDSNLEEVTLNINGRHDVCAVPRAVPVVEAYTNIILADLILFSRLNKLA